MEMSRCDAIEIPPNVVDVLLQTYILDPIVGGAKELDKGVTMVSRDLRIIACPAERTMTRPAAVDLVQQGVFRHLQNEERLSESVH
jgi:ABC-type phosphonate transport system ATPase subunit